jgi:hypothetical protein
MELSCKLLKDFELQWVEREIQKLQLQIEKQQSQVKELNAAANPCDDAAGAQSDEGHSRAQIQLQELNSVIDSHNRALAGCIDRTKQNDFKQQETLGNDALGAEVAGNDFLAGRAGRAGRNGKAGITSGFTGGIRARDCAD